MKFPIRFLAALAVIAIAAGPALAQSGADFFKGKTITYIVATSPGGGYDTYGRLIAKFMAKHLPGSKIIVKNVPGAGHIIGANQIYAAKPNGLTIGSFNTGLVYAQLVGREGMEFDLGKFTYIGKAAADPRTIITSTKNDIDTFEKLRNAKKAVKFAGSGPGSASFNETNMLINALKLNIRYLPGYNGRQDEMAMMRGEVDGGLGSLSSFMLFVKNGNARFLLQIGGKQPPGYEHVPLAADVIKDPAGQAVIALISSQAELARLTAAPPGLPKDRADALIAAYKAALTDPELIARAKKLGRPIVPLFGKDVGDRIRAALNQPADIVAMVKGVLEKKASGTKVTGKLLSVTPDGKKITFNGKDGKVVKSKVSGSRTKVVINGKPDNRKSLKTGMDCNIEYKPGGKNEPIILDCK